MRMLGRRSEDDGRATPVLVRLLTRDIPDPKYEEEVSGCTACVGIITDDKIYLVSLRLSAPPLVRVHGCNS